MQLPTLTDWLESRQLTEDFSNSKINYVNTYSGKRVNKIPVAEEIITKVPISLYKLLKTYITAKVSGTNFETLNIGVRFAIVKNGREVKILIWPQHVLHEDVLKAVDNNLYKVYSRLRNGQTNTDIFLFTGTLLASDRKIQSNESVGVVNNQVSNLYPQFTTDFELSAQDIKFFK